MSDKKYKQNSTAPLIATIAVALAAIAAVIVLLVMMSGGDTSEQSEESGFRITAELIEECTGSAHDLVKQNYEIIKLFVTEGLPKASEPYGNPPEDGMYTVDSKEYTALSQIEELVQSVYVEGEADRILHSMDVTLDTGAKTKMEIYKNRIVFGETKLGIDENFRPNDSYASDWSDCLVEVEPISDTECTVTVYLGGISPDEASAHPESVLKTGMVLQSSGWRLTEMLL